MKDGIYAVSFVGPAKGTGTGVCYVENGKIRGGDTGFAYHGTVTPDNNAGFIAEIKVKRHSQTPNMTSVFGPVNTFELKLDGTAAKDKFTLNGTVPGQPSMKLQVIGKRVDDLP